MTNLTDKFLASNCNLAILRNESLSEVFDLHTDICDRFYGNPYDDMDKESTPEQERAEQRLFDYCSFRVKVSKGEASLFDFSLDCGFDYQSAHNRKAAKKGGTKHYIN